MRITDATSSQILILQLLLHFCFGSLHVLQLRVCDCFIVLQKASDTSASLSDPECQRNVIVVCMNHVLDDIAALLQCS